MNVPSVDLNGAIMVPTIHKTGPWNLSDLKDIEKNGYKVFSCFHCGGGSTMGYKLSGFDVLGGVEIDPQMMAIYKANHNPKHSFLMGVQDFNKIPREDLPAELFDLDILDGSPPCSSFSMAGSREKAWGKNKKFREGQATQVLDDLFFHFIETARILQPKIVIAENVKGLVMGKAKGYVKEIAQMFNHAGYDLQLFLLNAAFMGVPQRRERTFFVARRKDLGFGNVDLKFAEKTISTSKAIGDLLEQKGVALTPETKRLWEKCGIGKALSTVHPKGHRFNAVKANPNEPCNTIPASADGNPIRWDIPNRFNEKQCARITSFPDDYNFGKFKNNYVCGMSVPPYMMNRISKQVELQWLDKLNG